MHGHIRRDMTNNNYKICKKKSAVIKASETLMKCTYSCINCIYDAYKYPFLFPKSYENITVCWYTESSPVQSLSMIIHSEKQALDKFPSETILTEFYYFESRDCFSVVYDIK